MIYYSWLARIFHSETGKTMANHCSAGFPACRIAGFQTCVPCLFNHAFERVCAPLFIGFFASLSKMAMKGLPYSHMNLGLNPISVNLDFCLRGLRDLRGCKPAFFQHPVRPRWQGASLRARRACNQRVRNLAGIAFPPRCRSGVEPAKAGKIRHPAGFRSGQQWVISQPFARTSRFPYRKTPLFFAKAPALNVPHLHIPLSICTLPPET
jgi:hypothetical protein